MRINLGVRRAHHRLAGAVLAAMLAPLVAAAAAAAAANAPQYVVVDTWKLGGVGGWDYLTIDAPRHRLFITRGDRIDVVDVGTGKVTGSIAGASGAHGVALAPDLKRGYVSNGRGNSVTEFDFDSLAVLRTVPVPGTNPDAILYEPSGRHLYTFNGKSSDVTVFDATTLAVVASIPVPGKPEFARADGKGHVYVNIETGPGQMVRIDALKLVVDATWPLAGCNSPSGLAIDRAHGRLFSVCDDKVMAVTDAATGKAVARVPIGNGPDAAEFDAEHGLAFSSNGADGTLTIVRQESPDKYTVAATVPTRKGARTMAFDPTSGRIYLVTAEFGPPPAATADTPRPRPPMIPDTFTVLVAAPR
jgi:YVTN family beta-propeller protein